MIPVRLPFDSAQGTPSVSRGVKPDTTYVFPAPFLCCRRVRLSPDRHDRLVAQVSHLPHLAAVGLTLTPSRQALRLAGSGFADTTRIALSSPGMWEEICRANAVPIIRSLDRFIARMRRIRSLAAGRRFQPLLRTLRAAQSARSGLKQ
jgi:prephenate dehydrogenase